jgi:quercetin dioxygenase-like cupin family protein
MIFKQTPDMAPRVDAPVDGRIMHAGGPVEAILLTLPPGETMDRHRNPFDVLFAGISGSAALQTNEGDILLQPGDTVFVTSDEERGWHNASGSPFRVLVIKLLQA